MARGAKTRVPLWLRPGPCKGRYLDTHSLCVCIDVGLRKVDPESFDTMERCNAAEDRVSQRFLKIVALGAGQLDNLAAKKVIIPRLTWQILGRCREVIEPNLDADQQSLRRPDFELVEADIGL